MRDPLKALGVPRVVCPTAMTREHLDGFVGAFVLESSRVRVRHLLRRSGWRAAVSSLVEKRLDARVCRPDADQSRPVRWDSQFLGTGVYIADVDVGLSMTLEQASAVAVANCEDAIFSIRPGVLAVFLNHEWGVHYCSA